MELQDFVLGIHEERPVVGANPSSAEVQVRHAVDAVSLENVPTWHDEHWLISMELEKWPTEQFLQALEPRLLAYVPTPHEEHITPLGPLFPTSHFSQEMLLISL
jgi:hypothetical protein